MKIGFFNSIVFDRHSGGRTRAMNIYRDLSENYEVEFINLSLPNKSKPSGDINYFDASWKSRFLPTHACRLITVLRALNYSIKKGFDIGYAYRSVGGVPIVAFMFSLLARKKLILGVNDFPSNNETLLSSTFVKNFIRTYILNKSDAVIAEYNEKIVSHLLELGVSKQKIKILPSRIEIKEYDFNPLPKNQVLKIFYVGRDQDIDLLINSARKLNKKYDKAKFIIAGVEEKGHPEIDNIQYLGKIPHSEVKNLLSTADVCVVPYSKPTTAGVPVKIFEYMAGGADSL